MSCRTSVWRTRTVIASIATASARAVRPDRNPARRSSRAASQSSAQGTAVLFQFSGDIVIQLVEHAGDGSLDLGSRLVGLQLSAERIEQQLLFPRLTSRNQARNPVPHGKRLGELRLGFSGIAGGV